MAANTQDVTFTGAKGAINPDQEYLDMFGLSEDFARIVNGDIVAIEAEEEKKDKNGKPYRRFVAKVTLHGPKGDKCTGYYRKATFDFLGFDATPAEKMAAFERKLEKMQQYEGGVDLSLLITNAHTFKRSEKGYISCTIEHLSFFTEPAGTQASPDTVDEATRKAVIQQQQQATEPAPAAESEDDDF